MEYAEQLYGIDRSKLTCLYKDTNKINRNEVIYAIMAQKNTIGLDKIYAKVLKFIAEKKGKGLTHLVSSFNEIYSTGQISIDCLKSIFI